MHTGSTQVFIVPVGITEIMVETLGAASGLFLVSWGTLSGESVIPMVEWVVLGPLAAGVVVLFLPETGRRELEDISADA